MSFEIIITPGFLKSLKGLAKRHKSLKQDFKAFSQALHADPFQGVELFPGLRKIRMAISSKGRGKSGGARVITYTIVVAAQEGTVYMIDIYDKSDYDTVDVAVLRKIVEELDL